MTVFIRHLKGHVLDKVESVVREELEALGYALGRGVQTSTHGVPNAPIKCVFEAREGLVTRLIIIDIEQSVIGPDQTTVTGTWM